MPIPITWPGFTLAQPIEADLPVHALLFFVESLSTLITLYLTLDAAPWQAEHSSRFLNNCQQFLHRSLRRSSVGLQRFQSRLD